jgi:hypothetical protein
MNFWSGRIVKRVVTVTGVFKDALERLSGTRITTNLKANGEEDTQGFGLIESWRIVRETKSGG